MEEFSWLDFFVVVVVERGWGVYFFEKLAFFLEISKTKLITSSFRHVCLHLEIPGNFLKLAILRKLLIWGFGKLSCLAISTKLLTWQFRGNFLLENFGGNFVTEVSLLSFFFFFCATVKDEISGQENCRAQAQSRTAARQVATPGGGAHGRGKEEEEDEGGVGRLADVLQAHRGGAL